MDCEIRMTKLAQCAGCGAKVGAGMLSALLEGLPTPRDERLLVGYDTSDDASVYQISEELALVQTVDFFPPIVDDPYLFGQIAAANAISDVYAMGGEPRLALNIMCMPKKLPDRAVREILRGGYEKAAEAGVMISGGHSIQDEEPKYGLAVTGFVHPQRYLRNNSAREGDVLILTKPLGIGIITTAHKAGLADEAVYDMAVKQMAQLNRDARDVMVRYPVNACTDVTGFSLLGHTLEMTGEGRVTAVLNSEAVPLLPGVLELARLGLLPEGMYRNRHYAQPHVKSANSVSRERLDAFYDPQTSGGLLIAVRPEAASALLSELKDKIPCAGAIGTMEAAREDCAIFIR